MNRGRKQVVHSRDFTEESMVMAMCAEVWTGLRELPGDVEAPAGRCHHPGSKETKTRNVALEPEEFRPWQSCMSPDRTTSQTE
jgi:hypothetical protein